MFHSLKRPSAMLCLALTTIAIAGCGDDEPGKIARNAGEVVANIALQESNDVVGVAAQPEAEEFAESAEPDLCYGSLGCLPVHEKQEAKSVAVRMAAAESNTAELRKFFPGGSKQTTHLFSPSEAALKEAAGIVAANAALERAPADLLILAGELYLDGEYLMQDFKHAIALGERAWLADRQLASALLASIYLRMGDLNNTYLWSVRCIGECRSSPYMVHQSTLLEVLDPAVILSIQESAADRIILRVRPSSHMR